MDRTTYFLTMVAVVSPLVSIAAAGIFLALACLSFFLEKLINKDVAVSFPPIKAPLFLFMATTVIAYLYSPEPELGSPPLRKFVLFVILLLVVNKFSKQRVLQTYHGLFGVGFVAAGFSIYQHFFLSQGSVEARLTGFMGHWMTMSGEMMLVFVSLASYLVFASPTRRLLWSFVFCIVALSLALTLTRSIWIATTVGLTVILLMRRYHWKTFAALGLALLALVLTAPQVFQKRMQSIFDSEDPSNYARFAIWKAGLRMVGAHPWVGVGPQRVSKVFFDYHPNANDRHRSGFFPVHMHNNLLQFAAERGLPCAFAWLWFILKMALDHWKAFHQEQSDRQVKTIHAIGFVSIFVLFLAGLFEFNFGDSEVLRIFLFLVSAPYCLGARG